MFAKGFSSKKPVTMAPHGAYCAESITDQIFIKAQRIRTLEEKKVSKVGEDITGEYIGIVNYCVIAMMQLDCRPETPNELNADDVEMLFDGKVTRNQRADVCQKPRLWRGLARYAHQLVNRSDTDETASC
jgi:hypothetical protein